MPLSLRRLSTVLLTLALGSCSPEITSPPPSAALSPAGEEPLVTDQSRYTLDRVSGGWRGTIRFVFTNQTGRTISLLNCNGAYSLRLEKWEGDRWVNAWSPALPECLSPPIRIEPGSAFPDVVEIFAGHRGSNTHPQFTVEEIDGFYRLVVDGAYWNYSHDGPDWGEKPPLEHRVSNTFEIRAM